MDLAGGVRMSARDQARVEMFTAMWTVGRVRRDIADAMGFENLETVSKYARRLGLPNRPELKAARQVKRTTDRACMTCRGMFPSHGSHNRMCDDCREHPSTLAYAHPGIRVTG